MSETTLANMTLGEYLCRLRESRNLSQRQAAKEARISYAYLSQIEGSKRGKRKTGDEHFAPHPQILKKLADVYHISAAQLFERAGYLGDKQNFQGFSEEREIDRTFDFVIHDPALKQILAVLDKRAIISRYEMLTGKRLITWAGEPAKHPSVNKMEFSGLRCENGLLFSDTPNTKLTLKEVAQELECEEMDVETMIRNNQLKAEQNDFKEWLIEKRDLQKFKIGGIRNWIHTGAKIPVAKPTTREEFYPQLASLDEGGIADQVEMASTNETLAKKKNTNSRK